MTGLIVVGRQPLQSGAWLAARPRHRRHAQPISGGPSALFLPAAVYVAVIPLLGIYVASALYLFGALRLQSRLSASCARSSSPLVAAVVLYVVFERIFQVALPHGLLGAVLGSLGRAMENFEAAAARLHHRDLACRTSS